MNQFIFEVMSTDPLDRVSKLFEARSKLEGQLKKAQLDLKAAIEKGDRKVRVENLAKVCNEQLAAAVEKNNELLKLAQKTEEKDKLKKELEDWLDAVTGHNHNFMEDTRRYMDGLDDLGVVERARDQLSTKSKGTSKLNSCASKSSSQRKRELALAKMRREEAERQCEAALRLQQVKNRLALEEVEENNTESC